MKPTNNYIQLLLAGYECMMQGDSRKENCEEIIIYKGKPKITFYREFSILPQNYNSPLETTEINKNVQELFQDILWNSWTVMAGSFPETEDPEICFNAFPNSHIQQREKRKGCLLLSGEILKSCEDLSDKH